MNSNDAYKPLPLRKNFVWSFIGSGIYAASQWAILVILAKFTNVEMVGEYSLAVSICAPIVLFTGFNIRDALASDAANEYTFGQYLALRVCTAVISFFIIAGITLHPAYSITVKLMILLIGVNKLVEDFSTISYGLFQKYERMDLITRSMILRGVIGLLVFALVLELTKSVLCGVVAWNLWSIIRLFMYDLAYSKKFNSIKLDFEWSKLVMLTRKTFPLAIVMGIMSLKPNIPRYFVAGMGGEELLGYYSAVMALLLAANMPNQALATAAISRFSQYHKNKTAHFMKFYWKLMCVALFLMIISVVGCWLFGEFILTVVYTPDYAKYLSILWIGVIGTGFGFFVSMGSSAFIATRKFHWQPVIYGVVLAINILSCALLIPNFGVNGAAWSTVITNGVHAVSFMVAVRLSTPQRSENVCQ